MRFKARKDGPTEITGCTDHIDTEMDFRTKTFTVRATDPITADYAELAFDRPRTMTLFKRLVAQLPGHALREAGVQLIPKPQPPTGRQLCGRCGRCLECGRVSC